MGRKKKEEKEGGRKRDKERGGKISALTFSKTGVDVRGALSVAGGRPVTMTDMVARCRLLTAHGLTSCLSVRTQPPTATGAPSQTSTMPYHATHKKSACLCGEAYAHACCLRCESCWLERARERERERGRARAEGRNDRGEGGGRLSLMASHKQRCFNHAFSVPVLAVVVTVALSGGAPHGD